MTAIPDAVIRYGSGDAPDVVQIVPWTGIAFKIGLSRPCPLRAGHLDTVEIEGLPSDATEESLHGILRLARRLVRPGGRVTIQDAPGSFGPDNDDMQVIAHTCGLDIIGNGPALILERPDAGDDSLVSIVIPAYKAGHLREALVSALEQDHRRTEIIVCDDDPTGAVAAVVGDLGAGADRVRRIDNGSNLGGRANYLQCLDVARGEYVKYLNDDDVLAPDCVSTMAACLDDRPDVGLVTSYRALIDDAGSPLPDQPFNVPLDSHDLLTQGEALATLVLTTRCNRIGEPTTVMFRRRDLAGNRPHAMSYAGRSALRNGDMSMWTTLLSRGDAVIVSRALSSFRQHAGQVQHSDVFRAEAERAWDLLIGDARRTGLILKSVPAIRRADILPRGMSSAGWSDLTSPWCRIPVGASADVQVEEASRQLDAGDLESAAARLDAALRIDPGREDARAGLALVLWERGRRSAALSTLGLLSRSAASADALDPLAGMMTAAGMTDARRALEDRLQTA